MPAAPAGLSQSDRLLIVAMQLIRAAVQGPGSAAAAASAAANTQRFNAAGPVSTIPAFDRPSPVIIMGPRPLPVTGGTGGGGPPKPPDAASGLAKVFKMIGDKFLAVAGPLAVVAAVLSSTTSGFQTLGTAVRVLAAAISPILLPATILLAAALVAVADVVTATLMPGLEAFFTLILAAGLPTIIALVSLMADLGGAIAKVVGWINKNVPEAGGGKGGQFGAIDRLTGGDGPRSDGTTLGRIKSLNRGLDDLTSTVLGPLAGPTVGAKNWLTRQTGSLLGADIDAYSGKGVVAAEGGAAAEKTATSALRDTIQSLKQSIGPKAQISGIGDVGKQVQLVALNNDPLEARMLRVQIQIANLLEQAYGDIASGPPPARAYDPAAAAALADYERGRRADRDRLMRGR